MEIDIQINGKKERVQQDTIGGLVEARGLAAVSLVVELNGRIVKQAEWERQPLATGDVLELLNFVGGG